ncbi:hypothetical protein C1645_841042 [Glomus cerebriforme]|uniref:Helitron helicase-like domain-containing protein n=1 Tax=Glomus cerebriforme TaxID=658196 RepID=A0A397S186_9GLOM|nr:hypothetical protein C1645_841042 [Glomus cerebriforme]
MVTFFTDFDAISFRKNIRAYNGILACSSFGANIDGSFQGQGVSNFKIHGQIYHRIGSLLPDEELAVYVGYLQPIVRDLFWNDGASAKILMRIYCDRSHDARRYNAPAASDVAAIMVGDGYEIEPSNRDIVLNLCNGTLQRISELHPSYDPLQYVLLFPNSDNGWHLDIPLTENTQRKMVTPMQFYSYRTAPFELS